MAADGNNIVRYIYRGEEDERIPVEATHITVGEGVTFVRAHAFRGHQNIIEVICHDGVETIEERAFDSCPSLRRVIMTGVKEIEKRAFHFCEVLTNVECDKLEVIGEETFSSCFDLGNIDLPSATIVEYGAFTFTFLTDVKFSSRLERIGGAAFGHCSFERITLPLKDGMITANDIFTGCFELKHLDLIEGAILNDTIAALLFEEWKNDMNEEIDSINQILPNLRAGDIKYGGGEKTWVIRMWMRSVLGKIVHYKAEHQRILDEAATTLHHVLPNDIVLDSILSFLELPSYTFEGEEEEEGSDGESDDEEDMEEE